ncbi:MAG: DUF559 domain-containing protein [Flavobacteriia bacterium]|nr:DUF559 domain-containing protein [Flavobacteriia bacterium]
MYSNHNYNKALRPSASKLRNNSTSKAEKLIWKKVFSRKQLGVNVKRQRPIDRYIVDFFIPDFKLIVEIDGSSHEFKGEEDIIRQTNLEHLGYCVLRFREQEVINDLVGVRDKIIFALSCRKESTSPPITK